MQICLCFVWNVQISGIFNIQYGVHTLRVTELVFMQRIDLDISFNFGLRICI